MTPIIEKLQRLENLRQRAGTEQEAAVAALRIKELLAKHNLDIGVLTLEKQEGVEMPAGRKIRTVPDHWPILVHAVNELLDVASFGRGYPNKGWQYFFVGLPANVETACQVFPYLVQAVEDLLQRWKTEESFWPMGRKPDYRAFRLGCSKRIYDRIMAAKRQPAPMTQELVHVGNAVAKRMIDGMQFEHTQRLNTRVPNSHVAGYHAGYQRGDEVDPEAARRKRIRRRK